jgi:hypothetical protein
MPTLYPYATDYVDGTIFDNIQRRIAHTETAGGYRLTEYPIEDKTNGKADAYIEGLTENLFSLNTSINQYTDMLKTDRDLLTYETTKMENISALKQNVKQNIKNIYVLDGELSKFERKLKLLREYIPYVSLTNFLDFRTIYDTYLTSVVDLVAVGTDLMDFLIEDGLVKTKGYSEVFIDTTGVNEEGETPYYRRKITDKMLKKKMGEIAKRPDFVWSMEYDDEELDAEANRVNLINQALEELGEKDYFYNPNQKEFEDEDYDLWYDRMTNIFNEKRFIKQTQQALKKERQSQANRQADLGIDPIYDVDYPDYVPFVPDDISYDEEGNPAEILEPEQPNIQINTNLNTEDKEMEEIFNEEKEMLRGIKLISNLLKKINEPFAKLWTKMTNVVMSIDEIMMYILNNFNVYRQQKLDDPNNLNIEKEGLLDNPYGIKGGNFTKKGYWEEKRGGNTLLSELVKGYKDGKVGYQKKPNNNSGVSLKYIGFNPEDRPKPNIQLEGGYAGLSHPSRREMARYYGSGGSKYM